LTSGALPEIYPRFTPDGSSVIYSIFSSQPGRIWKIPAAGGIPSIIPLSGEADDAYGDVSPDGQWLVFARTQQGVTRLHIAPINGGAPRLLTQSPSTLPRWSSDGQWIAFARDRAYTNGIYVIRPDGSGERRLTESGGWPVWWPDGKQVGYQVIGPDGTQQIQTVPIAGGAPTTLSQVTYNGTNNPFDVASNGLLVTTNTIHLTSEIWLMEPSSR
jgi:TolB protein